MRGCKGVTTTDQRRGPQELPRDAALSRCRFLDQSAGLHRPSHAGHQRRAGERHALERFEHRAFLPFAGECARSGRGDERDPRTAANVDFTIASLEHFQFIGGPFFNSPYTASEPIIWLSNDPVMMDSLARDRINAHRKKEGFEPVDEEIRTLEFAETLGCGFDEDEAREDYPGGLTLGGRPLRRRSFSYAWCRETQRALYQLPSCDRLRCAQLCSATRHDSVRLSSVPRFRPCSPRLSPAA